MTTRVLRYEVPVDYQAHVVQCGPPVYLDCVRSPEVVELWALDNGAPTARTYRAFGTGDVVPDGWEYRGSVLSPEFAGHRRGTAVWHLFEEVQ